MKTVQLSGSSRASVGKTDAASLRKKGMVPCVIYGAGNQVHFSADSRHFKNIIYTPDTNLVEIDVEGKKYKTILQEAQFNRITDNLMHADFLEVNESKPVRLQLPVKTIGQAEGVKAGGRMSVQLRKLKVKGLISKMPPSIDINVEKLTIGKSVSAGDIKIDGLTILHPKNISVVSVNVTRQVVEEAPAATAATATPAAGATPAAPGAPAAAAPAAPAAGAKAPAAPAKK